MFLHGLPIDDPCLSRTAHGFKKIIFFVGMVGHVKLSTGKIPFSHPSMSYSRAGHDSSQISRNNSFITKKKEDRKINEY